MIKVLSNTYKALLTVALFFSGAFLTYGAISNKITITYLPTGIKIYGHSYASVMCVSALVLYAFAVWSFNLVKDKKNLNIEDHLINGCTR